MRLSILEISGDHNFEESNPEFHLYDEDALSQDSSQEWEVCEIVAGQERTTFTIEYMKAVVDCFDKYGFSRVQQRYKRVKHTSYISRFRKYIHQNGTNSEKFDIARRFI